MAKIICSFGLSGWGGLKWVGWGGVGGLGWVSGLLLRRKVDSSLNVVLQMATSLQFSRLSGRGGWMAKIISSFGLNGWGALG